MAYISVAKAAEEISNRLGHTVHESYIRKLCKDGDIEAEGPYDLGKGRKRNTYMINENHLDDICFSLSGITIEKPVEKEEEHMEVTEVFDQLEPGVEYLTTAEAAKCLGIQQSSVSSLIAGGYLPAKKVRREGAGARSYTYKIAEKDVEERMRAMEVKRENSAKKEDISKKEILLSTELEEKLQTLQRMTDGIHVRLDAQFAKTNMLIERAIPMAQDKGIDNSKDQMESYKEGFKEGWKAAMEAMGGK